MDPEDIYQQYRRHLSNSKELVRFFQHRKNALLPENPSPKYLCQLLSGLKPILPQSQSLPSDSTLLSLFPFPKKLLCKYIHSHMPDLVHTLPDDLESLPLLYLCKACYLFDAKGFQLIAAESRNRRGKYRGKATCWVKREFVDALLLLQVGYKDESDEFVEM